VNDVRRLGRPSDLLSHTRIRKPIDAEPWPSVRAIADTIHCSTSIVLYMLTGVSQLQFRNQKWIPQPLTPIKQFNAYSPQMSLQPVCGDQCTETGLGLGPMTQGFADALFRPDLACQFTSKRLMLTVFSVRAHSLLEISSLMIKILLHNALLIPLFCLLGTLPRHTLAIFLEDGCDSIWKIPDVRLHRLSKSKWGFTV
jgi:hypothetical protein